MTIQNQATTTTPSHSRFSFAGRLGRACAACKHQRRRCLPSCNLAPYFPAHKQNQFKNVQRLFGMGHITKLLNTVPENDRDDAMASILYEANMRAARPVGGCYSVVADLQRLIAVCQAELQIVKKNIAFQRARFLQNITYYDVAGNSVDDQMPFFENQEFNNNLLLES